ncbi:hypothetical protein [uncultured Sphingomonas sp.]|uniref:hypothetical protein n=1 Tax=uncultured Sphingomonas sp. TaxID=158754 RepID=UPI0025F591AD|nr:hypothetical protein [uncultured Sphingomonas sp.]
MLDRTRIGGPIAKAEFESHKGQSGWWRVGDTEHALDWLFRVDHITTAMRRGTFERAYD